MRTCLVAAHLQPPHPHHGGSTHPWTPWRHPPAAAAVTPAHTAVTLAPAPPRSPAPTYTRHPAPRACPHRSIPATNATYMSTQHVGRGVGAPGLIADGFGAPIGANKRGLTCKPGQVWQRATGGAAKAPEKSLWFRNVRGCPAGFRPIVQPACQWQQVRQ